MITGWRRAVIVGAFIAPTVLAGIGVESALSAAREARHASEDAKDAVARLQRIDAERGAENCLDAWALLDGARASIESSISGLVNLLIIASGQITPDEPPDPAAVEIVRGLVAPVVTEAQNELAAPTCSREAAQAELDYLRGGAP